MKRSENKTIYERTIQNYLNHDKVIGIKFNSDKQEKQHPR